MADKNRPSIKEQLDQATRKKPAADDTGIGPKSARSIKALASMTRQAGDHSPRGKAIRARGANAEGHEAKTRQTREAIRRDLSDKTSRKMQLRMGMPDPSKRNM